MGQVTQQQVKQRLWEEVQVDEKLPRLTMPITYKKVILNAAATWDYFPGHHNPEYAQEQGQETIYISTLFFQGFIDRVITDWAGPRAFVVKRKMSMQRSIFAGDTMHGEGKVLRSYIDDQNRHLVDIEIAISNQNGPCAPAMATVMLPTNRVERS